MIDLDWWEERAAILEYDHGMTRFAAETEAARRQGAARWRFTNAQRERDSQQARDRRSAVERDDENDVPRVLGASPEQEGSMPVGDVPPGRGGLVLSSLWA